MRVTKLGDSLTLRIPAEVADKLGLKEGDDVDIVVSKDHSPDLSPEERRQLALEQMRATQWPLPPGWKFDRDEANER